MGFQRNVKDIDNDTTRSYLQIYERDTGSSGRLLPSSFPQTEVVKPVFALNSVSSNLSIKAMNVDSAGGKSKSIFEIFRNGSLVQRVDASGYHGKIVGDDWFGGASLSADDQLFAYVASKKSKPNFFIIVVLLTHLSLSVLGSHQM